MCNICMQKLSNTAKFTCRAKDFKGWIELDQRFRPEPAGMYIFFYNFSDLLIINIDKTAYELLIVCNYISMEVEYICCPGHFLQSLI